MKSQQSGFAHALLIIGLVVTLVGVLGFVYWQNFIYKEPTATKTNIKVVTKPADSKENEELEPTIPERVTYEDTAKGYRFTYSSKWELFNEVPAEYASLSKAPFGECKGQFLVNKDDKRQVIFVTAEITGGDGPHCYSNGYFEQNENKWSDTVNWAGSYFKMGATGVISGRYSISAHLFNYKTYSLEGTDEYKLVNDSLKI